MSESDLVKLLDLRNFYGDEYIFESIDKLYDDYKELCYKKKIDELLEVKVFNDYNFANISSVDISTLSYEELEPYFYYYNLKNIRLFSRDDLEKYLNNFSILELKEKEIVRFTHKKNYIIFVAKKCK